MKANRSKFLVERKLTTLIHYLEGRLVVSPCVYYLVGNQPKTSFSLYKEVREFNILKALKFYWILSRSNLGDMTNSFLIGPILFPVSSFFHQLLLSTFYFLNFIFFQNFSKMFLNSESNSKSFSKSNFSETHNSPSSYVWSPMSHTKNKSHS